MELKTSPYIIVSIVQFSLSKFGVIGAFTPENSAFYLENGFAAGVSTTVDGISTTVAGVSTTVDGVSTTVADVSTTRSGISTTVDGVSATRFASSTTVADA